MSLRDSKKPILRLPLLHPSGMLLRILLLALISLWVSTSEVAGHVRPRALLVVQNTTILKIPVDTSTSPTTYGPPTSLVTGGTYIRTISVDEVRGIMYWSDNGKIKKSTLGGSNIKVIVVDTGKWVLGLVVDVVQNKLYFTDLHKKTLEAVSSDGTERTTLISDVRTIVGLAVNWITRRLIYTTASDILTSTLNGGGIVSALPTSKPEVSAVAIKSNDSICWAKPDYKCVECSDYSGDNEVGFDTTGLVNAITVESGVAYYTTESPNRVESTELTTGRRHIIDLGSYNALQSYGITALHWDDDELVLDPPVPATKAVQLIDGDTATCLALAQMDMYTMSANARRWTPQPRGKCVHHGLIVRRRIPDAMKTSLTVTITGRHLVCSNSHVKVSTRQTAWPQCETAGIYRACRQNGTTAPGNGDLSSCVAKCTCHGDDCKHVTIHIPNMQENWEICEIGLG